MTEPGEADCSEKSYGNDGKSELKSLGSENMETGDTLINNWILQ